MFSKLWIGSRPLSALSIVLVMILTACTGATETPTADQSGESPGPASSDASAESDPPSTAEPHGTLNVGLRDLGPWQCHPRLTGTPQSPALQAAGFESLVTMDAEGNYLPDLAESWSVSDDGRVWTFNLRQGVQFHHGYGEMTADDVIYSIQQSGAEGSLNGTAANMRRLWLAEDGEVRKIDDYTIEVDTGTPQFDMLAFVRTPNSGAPLIVSKKQVDEVGEEEADQNCAGTGPWELVEHTAEFWRFKAVRDHWRKTPEFDELVLHAIPEEATRIANFQDGRLDTLQGEFDSLPALEAVEGASLMGDAGDIQLGGAQVAVKIYGNWYDVARPGYDADLPWVADSSDTSSADWERARKVRLAMALAIDRDSIVRNLLRGVGEPAVLWAWMGHEDRLDPDMEWRFDPDEAMQLLDEAGYPDGFEITLIPNLRGAPAEVESCEAIATMWQNIGISVNFERIPPDTLRPELVERTYQGATCQGTSEQPEPINQIPIWTTVASTFNGGVEHPFLEEKVAEATSTLDVDERWEVQREIARFLFDNALDIGVYNVPVVYPVGPRIQDWSADWRYGDSRIISSLEYVRHQEP